MLPIRISGSWCRRHCRPAPAMANWRGLPLPISIPTSVPFRSSTVKSGKPRHVVLTDEGVQFFRRLCAGRAGDEIMLRKMSAAESGKIRLEESKKIAKEKSENSDDMRTLLRPRSRMLLKGDEGCKPDRVFVDAEDDRYRRCPLEHQRSGVSDADEHSDLSARQFSRQLRQSIDLILRPAIYNRHVLALDIAGVFKASRRHADASQRARRTALAACGAACARSWRAERAWQRRAACPPKLHGQAPARPPPNASLLPPPCRHGLAASHAQDH